MKTMSDSRVVPGRSVMLRMLAVFALLTGLFAFGANTAGAAEMCTIDGYSDTPVLTASPNPATPGSEVVITGTGFGPPGCETILKVGETEIGTVVVGEDGSFTFTWNVPADWPLGEAGISATGADGVVLASTTVEIVDATPTTVPGTTVPAPDAGTQPGAGTPPTQSGVLPKTGSQILPLVIGGVVLLIVGAGLVVLTMRRRSTSGT